MCPAASFVQEGAVASAHAMPPAAQILALFLRLRPRVAIRRDHSSPGADLRASAPPDMVLSMGRYTVLGAGAWGTALAKVLADNGNETWLWGRDAGEAKAIDQGKVNAKYLPEIGLPDCLHATSDLEKALKGAEMVVWVVPSHATRATAELARPYLSPKVPHVGASKGIENDSLMLMSEVMLDVLGPEYKDQLTFLSGPSFAREVGLQMPTNVVVAAFAEAAALDVQTRFAAERFRVYTSEDVVGAEVGGALKNVIAIAAGASDGLGFGYNTRAALITRGLAELTRLAVAKGANPMTMMGLAGMGDLVLTCTGGLSRNRTVGLELGKGRKLPDILESLGHVAEGVKTARSVYDLGHKVGVDLPISFEAYKVIHEEKAPAEALKDLLARPLKKEMG